MAPRRMFKRSWCFRASATSQSAMTKTFYQIAVGLVMGLFRGARKKKGEDSGANAHATMPGKSRPIAANLVSHASSRLRVSRLKRVNAGEWICHALNPMHLLDPLHMVVAELPGVRSKVYGAIFALTMSADRAAWWLDCRREKLACAKRLGKLCLSQTRARRRMTLAQNRHTGQSHGEKLHTDWQGLDAHPKVPGFLAVQV